MGVIHLPAPTIWLTGKPNAGKTTLARMLCAELDRVAVPNELLDGNELRQWLSAGLGFSGQERDTHVVRTARLAAMLNRHGVWSIVAVIAPFRKGRQEARRILGGNVVQVYLRCPGEVLEARDQKDLYASARSGEIKDFTGISSPYEEPCSPDLIIDTDRLLPEESLDLIWHTLRSLGRWPVAPGRGVTISTGPPPAGERPAETWRREKR